MSQRSSSGEFTDPVTMLLQSNSEVRGADGPCLVVIRGDRLGARVRLDRNELTIGRSSAVDFQIDSSSVSRRHCRFFRHQGELWIEDLRSTNHTLINGKQIERQKLADGDQIRIGKSVLKFLDTGNAESAYLNEMREAAIRDELTGLYNRRHIMDMLKHEIELCQRGADLVLAIIDIDLFKDINDQIGHVAGDAVLKQMGEQLQRLVRSADTLARIGGEEFVVLMPDTTIEDAQQVCERLRQAIDDYHFLDDAGRRLEVTVSIGLSAWEEGMDKLSDLLRQADRRLYMAKSNGRNSVVWADAD